MTKKLLTEEYRELLRKQHTSKRWGATAEKLLPSIVEAAGGRTEWLDYGAGSSGLSRSIKQKYPGKFNISEYEPSRPNSQPPEPREYVVCVDVLEHVEPDLLDNVLEDLVRVTIDKGFYTISCQKAVNILKDGRNAHLIVEPPEWWLAKISPLMKILNHSWNEDRKRLTVVVAPLD
jgi:hypothetical protein